MKDSPWKGYNRPCTTYWQSEESKISCWFSHFRYRVGQAATNGIRQALRHLHGFSFETRPNQAKYKEIQPSSYSLPNTAALLLHVSFIIPLTHQLPHQPILKGLIYFGLVQCNCADYAVEVNPEKIQNENVSSVSERRQNLSKQSGRASYGPKRVCRARIFFSISQGYRLLDFSYWEFEASLLPPSSGSFITIPLW